MNERSTVPTIASLNFYATPKREEEIVRAKRRLAPGKQKGQFDDEQTVRMIVVSSTVADLERSLSSTQTCCKLSVSMSLTASYSNSVNNEKLIC